jgi:hypothetical protein
MLPPSSKLDASFVANVVLFIAIIVETMPGVSPVAPLRLDGHTTNSSYITKLVQNGFSFLELRVLRASGT